MAVPAERTPGFRYSMEDKLEACKLYMLNGNMRIVSEVTNIPYDTLSEWKRSEWWPQLVEEIRLARKAKTGNKLSEIIEKSLEEIHDRINNGDYILNNKTGEIMRKPVSLRDAGQITNSLLTRQLEMERLAEKLEHRKETVQDTLTMLAKEFAKFNRVQSAKNAETIEFKEVDNAVYDQGATPS